MCSTSTVDELTIQKACALLEGLEAGLDRSALVCLLPRIIVVLTSSGKARTYSLKRQQVRGRYRSLSAMPGLSRR